MIRFFFYGNQTLATVNRTMGSMIQYYIDLHNAQHNKIFFLNGFKKLVSISSCWSIIENQK